MGLLHHQFIVLWQLMSVWRNNFSGPGTVILKVSFLCINSTRKPLLIHGFSPLNARLLTVYSTAFYAIIRVKKVFLFFFSQFLSLYLRLMAVDPLWYFLYCI